MPEDISVDIQRAFESLQARTAAMIGRLLGELALKDAVIASLSQPPTEPGEAKVD